jgi:enamine deaminase RidA (YjgF/YER057c/UK114 family)
LQHVVDVTVYLSDVRYFGLMNEVYRNVVPRDFPARTTVGAQLMSPDALVEIMLTARRP